MKVLEHGLTHQLVECDFCHAKLEICEEDIKPRFLLFLTPPFVVCPECDRTIDVGRIVKWAG